LPLSGKTSVFMGLLEEYDGRIKTDTYWDIGMVLPSLERSLLSEGPAR